MLFIILIGLVLLGACIPEATATGTGVIAISAKELFAKYAKDQAAADSLYKGRTLEVTGEVMISKSILLIEQYIIVLYGSEDPANQTWGVQCTFSNNTDTRLYQIEKRRMVTIRGRCDGLQQDVVLRNAELVNVKPK
jgi:hypothetical protein